MAGPLSVISAVIMEYEQHLEKIESGTLSTKNKYVLLPVYREFVGKLIQMQAAVLHATGRPNSERIAEISDMVEIGYAMTPPSGVDYATFERMLLDMQVLLEKIEELSARLQIYDSPYTASAGDEACFPQAVAASSGPLNLAMSESLLDEVNAQDVNELLPDLTGFVDIKASTKLGRNKKKPDPVEPFPIPLPPLPPLPANLNPPAPTIIKPTEPFQPFKPFGGPNG
jgi:hypothetical protein